MFAKPHHISVYESRDLKDYCKDRLEYKINLYEQKAQRVRKFYLIIATLSMAFAAIVPALIVIKKEAGSFSTENLATVLSVLVTILVGLQNIFRPRERWQSYGRIAALLRQEEMLFSTQTGRYDTEKDPDKRFKLLVRHIEELIANERNETIIIQTDIRPANGNAPSGQSFPASNTRVSSEPDTK